MAEMQLPKLTNVPAHVAIIMDGNGRWAKARGLDRSEGHSEGVKTVRQITEAASRLGVKYLTLYTFSTENWNRPQAEVDMLMHLVATAIESYTPELIENNVKLRLIGDTDRIPPHAYERLCYCMDATSKGTGLTLVLAISYSARWDITNASRLIAKEVAQGKLKPEEIDENTISKHLSTAFMPDPDLLIRTGGDTRISNYLLWEIAYSELYFVKDYWPDFTPQQFAEALQRFGERQRRFGLTGEQVQNLSNDPTNPLPASTR